MAFQANAFQSNAFQVCASQLGEDIALQRRRQKKREELLKQRRDEAIKRLEIIEVVDGVDEIKKELTSIEVPTRAQQLDVSVSIEQREAELERILTLISRLEDGFLEVLAILLLANEEL